MARLRQKYGAKAIDSAVRLHPHEFPELVEWRDELDPHYTKLWLDFISAGMYTRGILDDKTRILCVVGELVVLDEMAQGENHIRNAPMHGATPREILEVMLQATVYVGMPRFVRIVGVLVRILDRPARKYLQARECSQQRFSCRKPLRNGRIRDGVTACAFIHPCPC